MGYQGSLSETLISVVMSEIHKAMGGQVGLAIEQVILAAALVTIAAMVVWPQGRKPPKLIAIAFEVARALWARRSSFVA